MKIFYKSIILFCSILLFFSCNSIDDLSKQEDEELIYKYEKHKNNRVASLIMDDVQYNDWVKNNIFKSDVEKVMKLTKDIYKEFPDKYDFIILLLNEYETPKSLETTSATGDGFFKTVSNDINGIGCIIAQCTNPIYSNSYLFGSSEGKLKGVLHLGNRRLIKNGPIYGIIAAVLFLYFDWDVPGYLENTTFLLTYTTIFLVLMALGVALTRLKVVSWTHAAILGAVRVILGPIIGFALINFLGLTGFMAGVLLIQSAMPSAILTYLVGSMYSNKRAVDNIASIIVSSTLMSFITIPIVVYLSLRFFN